MSGDSDRPPHGRSMVSPYATCGQAEHPIDTDVIAHFGEATGIVPRPLPDEATGSLQILSNAGVRSSRWLSRSGSARDWLIPTSKKSIGRLVKALER